MLPSNKPTYRHQGNNKNKTANMAGNSALGRPTVISGWTAFSNPDFVKSTLSDMRETSSPTVQSNTNTRDIDSTVTSPVAPQSNNEAVESPTPDSELTQQEKDDLLLADPPRITGAALLDLASRHSTKDIVDLCHAATGSNITRAAINGRLNLALGKKADALGTTKDELRKELTEKRKAHGIRSTRREPARKHAAFMKDDEMYDADRSTQTPETEQADKYGHTEPAPQADAAVNTHQPYHTGESTEENSDADMGDAVGNAAMLLAQQKADQAAFSDQISLKGDKILQLAERYSNPDMSARICAIPGNFPLTENGVATRIHVALEKKAETTGLSIRQVREDLNNVRLANGVINPNSRGKGLLKAPQIDRKPRSSRSSRFSEGAAVAVAPAPKRPAPVDAEMAYAVRELTRSRAPAGSKEPQKKRSKKTRVKAEPVDTEMTSDDGADSQDGYDADAVEAANTLLQLSAGSLSAADSKLQEAATILMNMHRADALLAGQSGQGDDTAGAGDGDDTEIDDV